MNTPAATKVDGALMIEFANYFLKTPNFWLLVVGTFIIWAMTRYIPELLNSNYKKESELYPTTIIHRYRHRKIKRSIDKKTHSISRSAYANSTPDFVPLSESTQSAPPSPPHFKTPSRIVPTNYGSEIKLKLMTSEDKALRLSNLRERHMKYRPTISSSLNPIRRCELGQRSSVGVLSSRYLTDVRMDFGYNEDQRKNIIWAAGNRKDHTFKLGGLDHNIIQKQYT